MAGYLQPASVKRHREAINSRVEEIPVYSPPRFGVKTSMKRSVV